MNYEEITKNMQEVICINNKGCEKELMINRIYFVEYELNTCYGLIDIPYDRKDWNNIKHYIFSRQQKRKNRFKLIDTAKK